MMMSATGDNVLPGVRYVEEVESVFANVVLADHARGPLIQRGLQRPATVLDISLIPTPFY